MNLPTESSLRARRYAGRKVGAPDPPDDEPDERRAPMPVCAIAVPQADPSIPQSKP